MEANRENPWVADKLAALEPQWQPDATGARAALDRRLGARNRSWMWAIPATAALCVVVLAIPSTRATAQQLWDRFVLNRVDIVRVDLSRLPISTHVTIDGGAEERVADAGEAKRRAGFQPYLPPAEILSATPELKVSGPMHVEQTVRIGELRAALDKAGASDVQVPAEWQRLKLQIEIGPIVSADYPDVRIEQCRPLEFSAPSGIALDRLAEVAFRSVGVSEWEARALGQRFAAHPFWMLDIPPDEMVNLREVQLKSGLAMLIEGERASVVRSTGDRIYYVSSGSRELSLKIADSLPQTFP